MDQRDPPTMASLLLFICMLAAALLICATAHSQTTGKGVGRPLESPGFIRGEYQPSTVARPASGAAAGLIVRMALRGEQ
jgi:hypothetical protein